MSNKIFHYRVDGTHDECAADNPWSQWLINHETNTDEFTINHLVTIGGQPIISQHRATYLTGTDTCHAHHFAKMLAGTILSGSYQYAPSLTTSPTKPITIELYNGLGPNGTTRHHTTSATPGTVLWIDTIHSPYDCAQLYSEMKENFHFDDGNFNLVCLDMLGVFREDYYCVINRIESHISEVIEPDEKLSTEELAIRISKRQTQLNRINKARTIISQALTYGLIKKQNGSNTYILCSNKLDSPINTQLTLPPTLSATPTENSQERVVKVLRAASS